MAKQPIESHRFKIFCEAEQEQLGHILAQLTLLGVGHVGYELITDVKTFKARPKPDPSQPKAEDFASEWIAKNPTFRVSELGRYFKENGRAQATANYVVRVMAEKGRLRQLADGHYQSTEIKHIEGPKKAAKPAPAAPAAAASVKKTRTRPPNPTPRFETTNRELLEKSIRGKRRFTAEQIRQLFADNRRNPHSASPILWSLAKEKIIKVIAPGEYEVLPKKSKPPIAKNHASFLAQERIRAKNYRDNKKQQQEAPAPASVVVATDTTEGVVNG